LCPIRAETSYSFHVFQQPSSLEIIDLRQQNFDVFQILFPQCNDFHCQLLCQSERIYFQVLQPRCCKCSGEIHRAVTCTPPAGHKFAPKTCFHPTLKQNLWCRLTCSKPTHEHQKNKRFWISKLGPALKLFSEGAGCKIYPD